MKIYSDNLITLLNGDTFEYLTKFPNETVDIVIADPPYFLSNGGFTNSSGRKVSVDKGDWDKATEEEAYNFYFNLIKQTKRILKKNGCIWIFGTFHNIYTVGHILKIHGFKILNNVTWKKIDPGENLSHRMFTHSTETIIWAVKDKGKQIFNYDELKDIYCDDKLTDVWRTPTTKLREKKYGKHPAQKPISIMMKILSASTTSNSLVLDPFVGSGTTAVACKLLNRKLIGIEQSSKYLKIAVNRTMNFRNEYVDRIE